MLAADDDEAFRDGAVETLRLRSARWPRAEQEAGRAKRRAPEKIPARRARPSAFGFLPHIGLPGSIPEVGYENYFVGFQHQKWRARRRFAIVARWDC